jgi:hypothetical protein
MTKGIMILVGIAIAVRVKVRCDGWWMVEEVYCRPFPPNILAMPAKFPLNLLTIIKFPPKFLSLIDSTCREVPANPWIFSAEFPPNLRRPSP